MSTCITIGFGPASPEPRPRSDIVPPIEHVFDTKLAALLLT
jgi:hypothetical protein